MAPSGVLSVSLENVKLFKDVLIGNDIFVFGYPTSLGIKDIPQLDYNKPLLRKGIIAGQNLQRKSLVLDAPIYPGNSGGPVLEVEEEFPQIRFRVVGVVSQFVPFAEKWTNEPHGYTNYSLSNSGYSVATPMDFVMVLIDSSK